jgi:hypothetical protein
MSDLIACPTARTGYPTKEAAQAHLDAVLQSLKHLRTRERMKKIMQIQTCEQCEGFHVVQPKKPRTQDHIDG